MLLMQLKVESWPQSILQCPAALGAKSAVGSSSVLLAGLLLCSVLLAGLMLCCCALDAGGSTGAPNGCTCLLRPQPVPCQLPLWTTVFSAVAAGGAAKAPASEVSSSWTGQSCAGY